MIRSFGDFVDKNNAAKDFLVIGFRPSSLPLQQRWRNNGLSADFLADYVTTFFPADDEASRYRQAEIRDAVAYVANELLENAMKFSYHPTLVPVSISLYLHENALDFYVTNGAKPDALDEFYGFIETLLEGDAHELYIEQLEKNATEDLHDRSHLGFLTMITNYQAELAWKFEATNNDVDVIAVTTMVHLEV